MIFESGRIEFEGRADPLRDPHPALDGRLVIQHVPLEALEPIARRYGLALERGTLSARGALEYTPDVKIAELDEVHIEDLRGNWALDDQSEAPARRAATAGARAARDISNDPDVRLHLRRLEIRRADLGFINAKAEPDYRVFVHDATVSAEGLSNHRSSGTARVSMQGRLMDSGMARFDGRFRPGGRGPDFDLDLRLEDAELTELNDLLQAHAGVDVTSGRLTVYSEMRVRDGRVDGYVKPLFRDLEIYDPAQERQESPVAKLKEGAAELAAKLLRNQPRQEVATVVPISGPVSDPDAGTWQTLIGLLHNAFVQAILPGFEGNGRD
jgi:hypothetical protein